MNSLDKPIILVSLMIYRFFGVTTNVEIKNSLMYKDSKGVGAMRTKYFSVRMNLWKEAHEEK